MAMNFEVSNIRYAVSKNGLDNVCEEVRIVMSKSKTVTVPEYEVTPAIGDTPAVTSTTKSSLN